MVPTVARVELSGTRQEMIRHSCFLKMTFITPGVDFLAQILVPLSFFALIATYVNAFIAHRFDHTISTGTILFGCVFSLPPLATTIYILSTRFLHRRQAATLSARIVPEIKGSWPGNFDFLLSMLRELNEGYPGKSPTNFGSSHTI